MSYLSAYTDQESDSETGLMYYDARYYDSELKRFTSVDPIILNPQNREIDEPGRLSTHAYVLNNPLKYVDPTGEVTRVYESRSEYKVGGYALFTYGSHTGMSIQNSENSILYDPNGLSYIPNGQRIRSGDMMTGNEWTEGDYVDMMASEGSVNIYTINTTEEQEKAMIDRLFANDPVNEIPKTVSGKVCSVWTSEVLSEADLSEKNIGYPGNLGRNLSDRSDVVKATIKKNSNE